MIPVQDEKKGLQEHQHNCQKIETIAFKGLKLIQTSLDLSLFIMSIFSKVLLLYLTQGNLKHFMDHVRRMESEKIMKLLNKGMDPNFIESESGGTLLYVVCCMNAAY